LGNPYRAGRFSRKTLDPFRRNWEQLEHTLRDQSLAQSADLRQKNADFPSGSFLIEFK